MTSNHNVLDQYALCLHGAASKLLELEVGRHEFPSPVMDSAAPVPVHMEAMGLWHPPIGPGEPARDFAHPGPTAPGPPTCTP